MNNTQPNFALSPRSNLQLNGRCGFNIQNDRVSINIDSIANQRDNTNLSGTLAIELWALKQPYQGEHFEGVALAGTTIGEIQGQHFIPNCQYDLMFREPPAGNWHLALMLREARRSSRSRGFHRQRHSTRATSMPDASCPPGAP